MYHGFAWYSSMFVPKLFPSGFFDIVETSQDPDVHGTTSTVTAFTRYLPGGWRSFAAKALVYTCLMRLADLSDDDPLKFYLRELATVQPLTSRERADLLKQIRSGNNQAE